jgi:hypothetical protein
LPPGRPTFRLDTQPVPFPAIELSKPWAGNMPLSGLMIEPLIVRLPDTTDFGVMLVMVTGPTTHQSPLAYWPTVRSAENCQVTANRVTEVAADAGKLGLARRTEATSKRDRNARGSRFG